MITLVTGAPASGKSTYVRYHAKPGDVIIDLDKIKEFARGDEKLAARLRTAFENRMHTLTQDVWVVRTLTNPADRELYIRRHHVARVVELRAPGGDSSFPSKRAWGLPGSSRGHRPLA